MPRRAVAARRDQGVTDQDAHIAGYILDSGRAVVIASTSGTRSAATSANSWSAHRAPPRLSASSRRCIPHLGAQAPGWAAVEFDGRRPCLGRPQDATPVLTRGCARGREHQQPKRAGMFRRKLRYAHQGGQNPPIVVIHGNSPGRVSPMPTAATWKGASRPLQAGRHAAQEIEIRPRPTLRTNKPDPDCGEGQIVLC